MKLKVGDKLISVESVNIDSEASLSKALEAYLPNERVTVTVRRGGQTLSFEVILF